MTQNQTAQLQRLAKNNEFLHVASVPIVPFGERTPNGLIILRDAQAGLCLCISHATKVQFLVSRPKCKMSRDT